MLQELGKLPEATQICVVVGGTIVIAVAIICYYKLFKD